MVKSDPDTITRCKTLLGCSRGECALQLGANYSEDSEREVVDHLPREPFKYSSSSMEKQSELVQARVGRDLRLSKCMDQSYHSPGLEKSSHSDEQNDPAVSLDLQLKPPCLPQPRFDWLDSSYNKKDADSEMFDLSLSLVGNCIKSKSKSRDKEVQESDGVEHDSHSDSVVHQNSEPDKEVLPNGQSQQHFKGIRGFSVSRVMSYNRETTGVKDVMNYNRDTTGVNNGQDNLCGALVKEFYDKVENSCGSMVKKNYNKIEIDLNALPDDSYDGFHAPTNSGEAINANGFAAVVAPEVVCEDHHADNQDTQDTDDLVESASLSKNQQGGVVAKSSNSELGPVKHEQKELNSPMEVADAVVPDIVCQDQPSGKQNIQHTDDQVGSSSLSLEKQEDVAKSSNSVPEPVKLKRKELNFAKDVNGADGLEANTSQGNKASIPNALSEVDSLISSKVASDEVYGNDNVSGSNEDMKEFKEVAEGSSEVEAGSSHNAVDEGTAEEHEEIIEEVSGNDEADSSLAAGVNHYAVDEDIVEEYKEVVEEVSGDDEADCYGDMDTEEYEEVIEEVSCCDESDSSHHTGGAANADSQEDNAQHDNEDDEDSKLNEEIAVHSKKDVNNIFVAPAANSIPETSSPVMQSQEDMTRKHIQQPETHTGKKIEVNMSETLLPSLHDAPCATNKRPLNCTETSDEGDGKKSKWDIPPEAVDTKQGWETWETKPSFKKETVKVLHKADVENGSRTLQTKSDLKKNVAEATKSKIKQESRPLGFSKDIDESSKKSRPEESRREEVRRMHINLDVDVRKCRVTSEKQGRVIDLKPGDVRKHEDTPHRVINLNLGLSNNRSSYEKTKPKFDKPIRSRGNGSPEKSFVQYKPPHLRYRRNERSHGYKKYENGINKFGKRRSEYTWDRNDVTQSECEHAQECADAVPTSRRQVHEPREGHGRSGSKLMCGLQDSNASYAKFLCSSLQEVQTEDLLGQKNGSPNDVHNYCTDLRRSLDRPRNTVVRSLIAEVENRELNMGGMQYSEPVTSFQRNHDQRGMMQGHFFDEEYYEAWNEPPMPGPYAAREQKLSHDKGTYHGNFRNRLGNISGEQAADAEIYDDRPFKHDRYGNFRGRGNPRVSERNIRDRLGDRSDGHRIERDHEESYRFNSGKEWGDAGFGSGRGQRRRY